MEIVQRDGYTVQEKLAIAREHLAEVLSPALSLDVASGERLLQAA